MKYKGVKYNTTSNQYEATIGKRVIGSYKTELEAAKAYNEQAKKVFVFPILNNIKEIDIDNNEDP